MIDPSGTILFNWEGLVNQPYFKNAPLDVQFVGGDPELLRKVQTVELGILGDRDLADRLN